MTRRVGTSLTVVFIAMLLATLMLIATNSVGVTLAVGLFIVSLGIGALAAFGPKEDEPGSELVLATRPVQPTITHPLVAEHHLFTEAKRQMDMEMKLKVAAVSAEAKKRGIG